jgi:hypothetical protein
MNLLGEANRPRVTVYRKDAAAKGVNFAVVDDKSRYCSLTFDVVQPLSPAYPCFQTGRDRGVVVDEPLGPTSELLEGEHCVLWGFTSL